MEISNLNMSPCAYVFLDCVVTYIYTYVYRHAEEFIESARKERELTDIEQILCSRNFAKYCSI